MGMIYGKFTGFKQKLNSRKFAGWMPIKRNLWWGGGLIAEGMFQYVTPVTVKLFVHSHPTVQVSTVAHRIDFNLWESKLTDSSWKLLYSWK